MFESPSISLDWLPSPAMEAACYEIIPRGKSNKVFQKQKDNLPLLPYKVSNFLSFGIQNETQLNFQHHQNISQANIVFFKDNKTWDFSSYLREDQETFLKVYSSFQDYGFNYEYNKKFPVIRTSGFQKESNLIARYKAFLRDVYEKVYRNIYGKTIESSNMDIYSPDQLGSCINQEGELLKYDLLNESVVSIVLPLQEIFDKITDDEISSSFIMSSHSFIHPINCLLSSAALALSFFHYHLLSMKKHHKDELYYSAHSLPRVTYLSLTGIYSEIDIDVLSACSSNIQTIMVYDENTGGPSILTKGQYQGGEDFRVQKKHFHEISDKLLLVPLKCPNGKKEKLYGPNDILSIIEEIVIKSIEKYRPTYIVLNCSMIFEKDNDTPFIIDEATIARIIHLLNQVGNSKIIVFPFKLPNIRHTETQKFYEKSQEYLQTTKQQDRLESIFKRYAIPYNHEFFRDCFANSLESLADLKDTTNWNRASFRKTYGINPLKNETIHLLGSHYKTHNFYNFLYSKSFGTLAQVTKCLGGYTNMPTIDLQNKPIKEIPLLSSNSELGRIPLHLIKGSETFEVILDQNSQYLLDYEKFDSPVGYIFNAKIYQKTSNIKTYLNISHIAVEFDPNVANDQSRAILSGQFEVDSLRAMSAVKDSGLCKCENFVFQVYGTKIGQNVDSNEIFYFDFENKTYHKLIVEGSQPEILPRHSVTACAFKKGRQYYLYIFGGRVKSNTRYRNKELGSLDIIDIVEVYQTNDPKTSKWQCKLLPKDTQVQNKSLSFIPYKHSYAHYDKAEDKIVVMGGTCFENSVNGNMFPVFEFDVSRNYFDSFHVFLNDMKGNPSKKEIKGDKNKRATVPFVVADANKNYWYDQKLKTFKFLVPVKEEENIFCLYSYNWTAKKCDFEQINVLSTENPNKIPDMILYKNESKDVLSLSHALLREMAYIFNSLERKEAFLEVVNWRLLSEKENISKEAIVTFLKSKKGEPKIESPVQYSGHKQARSKIFEDIQEKYTGFERIISLLKRQEYQEIFCNKDNRLGTLKKYLIEAIGKEAKINSIEAKEISFSEENQFDHQVARFRSIEACLLEQAKDHMTDGMKTAFPENTLEEQPKDLEEVPAIKRALSRKEENKEKEGDSQDVESTAMKSAEVNNKISPLKKKSDIEEFKSCLESSFSYRAFFNEIKSGVTVFFSEGSGAVQHKTLRFKVILDGVLEDISFSLSPSSITIYQGAVICYIDQEFKRTHEHLYEEYKNSVLYANIGTAITPSGGKERAPKHLIFKKLFTVTGDESVFSRCLIVNELSLFLFGGKSVRFKGKKLSNNHKSLTRYNLKNLKEENQNASFIKDTELDEMEANSGECVAVYNGKYVFITKRQEPTEVEIFKNDGTLEGSIVIPSPTDKKFTSMNLVNFRGKEEILITLYENEKDMEFLLYDIQKKNFEKEKVTLVPKEGVEGLSNPILYSGYEQLELNTNTQPLKDVLIYNIRAAETRFITYKIKVGHGMFSKID